MTVLSPQTLHAMGWTLLHFVWQGTALAALLAVALMVTRNANVRYVLGIATLMLMIAAPVVTFVSLDRAAVPVANIEMPLPANVGDVSAIDETASSSGQLIQTLAAGANRPDRMIWLVQAWFVGVLLLSLRTAGGLLWLARARRGEIEPLSEEMYRQCLELQRRMGLNRRVRYGHGRWLDAPAVLGWFRPVVLVTTQAMTGLTPQQLQAIIAHELAHVRRYDAFVNLFQVGVEMLLFYHPAVWWVSRRIRVEREVCCDQEALAACGEPVSYARALTLMEEWRAVPSLAMAANRGPLTERVLRLLGMQGTSVRSRAAGAGVSVLGAAVALFAGYVFVAAAQAAQDAEPAQPAQPALPTIPATDSPASIAPPAPRSAPQPQAAPAPRAAPEPKAAPATVYESQVVPALAAVPELQAAAAAESNAVAEPRSRIAQAASAQRETKGSAKPSYIEGLAAAGISNPTVEELIAMKMQGITPAYVEAMRSTQMRIDIDHLIAMRSNGVTPAYVSEMRQVVTDVGAEQIIAMRVHGVTPKFVRELAEAGLEVRAANEVIAAKVQGITPELIKSAVEHGFKGLTLHKLLALQHADVI